MHVQNAPNSLDMSINVSPPLATSKVLCLRLGGGRNTKRRYAIVSSH